MYIVKRLFVLICLIGLIFVGFNIQPVYAADNIVETNYFGNIQDDDEGCGIFMIMNLVIDILSMGVVIAGVIGVTIAGITYLTAKDSEEKTRKAKNRILEIVIGLVAYAVLYVGVQWLLPGGKANTTCKTLTDEQVANIKEKQKTKKEETKNKETKNKTSSSDPNSSYKDTKSYKTCMKKAIFESEEDRDAVCKNEKGSERIAKAAELLAAPSKKASKQCYPLTWKPTSWSQFKKCAPTKNYQYAYDKLKPGHWKSYSKNAKNVIRTGASCDLFVPTAINASGYDKIGLSHKAVSKLPKKAKWKKVKTAKRGDICQKFFKDGGGHVKIYLGNNKIAEASSGLKSGDKRWGGVTKGNCKGYTVIRATE